MNTQTHTEIHTKILFSHEIEEGPAISNNIYRVVGIVLGEISHAKKDSTLHHLSVESKKVKLIETESRRWLPGAGQ